MAYFWPKMAYFWTLFWTGFGQNLSKSISKTVVFRPGPVQNPSRKGSKKGSKTPILGSRDTFRGWVDFESWPIFSADEKNFWAEKNHLNLTFHLKIDHFCKSPIFPPTSWFRSDQLRTDPGQTGIIPVLNMAWRPHVLNRFWPGPDRSCQSWIDLWKWGGHF